MRSAWLLALVLVACDGASTRNIGGGGGGGGGGDGGGGSVPDAGHADAGSPMPQSDDLATAFLKTSACQGARLDDDYLEARRTLALVTGPSRSEFDALVSCIKNAADCPAVLRCLSYLPDQSCDPDTFSERCESGIHRVDCHRMRNGLALTRRTRCGALFDPGSMCAVVDGDAFCHAGTCPMNTPDRCDGAKAVGCDSRGHLHENDCALMGASCILRPNEGARCGLAGSSCMDDACDGHTIVDCSGGVVRSRVPCDRLEPSFTCLAERSRVVCGRPADRQECQDGEERCEGAIARACVGGKWFDFDCRRFKNGGCDVQGGGLRCKLPDWP